MPKTEWVFPARFENTIDGDTISVLWDLGDDIHRTITIRAQDVDTTEISRGHDLSRQWATAGEDFTFDWCLEAIRFGPSWPLILHTDKLDKRGNPRKTFARYVAMVRREYDGEELTQQLIAKGYGLGAKGREESRRPLGAIWPGDWTREAGTRSKAHLISQNDLEGFRTACGRHIESPTAAYIPTQKQRCSRCWKWCAYSSPLWAQIVAENVPLSYGGRTNKPLMASEHPGAQLLLE